MLPKRCIRRNLVLTQAERVYTGAEIGYGADAHIVLQPSQSTDPPRHDEGPSRAGASHCSKSRPWNPKRALYYPAEPPIGPGFVPKIFRPGIIANAPKGTRSLRSTRLVVELLSACHAVQFPRTAVSLPTSNLPPGWSCVQCLANL